MFTRPTTTARLLTDCAESLLICNDRTDEKLKTPHTSVVELLIGGCHDDWRVHWEVE